MALEIRGKKRYYLCVYCGEVVILLCAAFEKSNPARVDIAMWNLPNILSLVRLPLAFLFLSGQVSVRALALVLAFLSDVLDGYLARRYSQASAVGALLDPLMDKLFVGFAIATFWREGRLAAVESCCLLSRDVAVALYGIFLLWERRLTRYQVRAIWCGKVSTAGQFAVLMALLFEVGLPLWCYLCFVALGAFALIELYCADSDRPAVI